MKYGKRLSRRRFLQRSAASALLGSGAFAVNGKVNLIASALAASSDYATLTDSKALVCVYLAGGCDTLNMFLPAEAKSYGVYSASRGTLAVKPGDVLFTGNGSNKVGINRQLPALHQLYNSGELAIVQNVGNLMAPVTRNEYFEQRPWLPPNLFSHRHQREIVLHASSRRSPIHVGSGWGGRMADLLEQANNHPTLPQSFSVAGDRAWLSGDKLQPLSVGPDGIPLLEYLDARLDIPGNEQRHTTLNKILALPRKHALKAQASAEFSRSRNQSQELRDVLSNDYIEPEYSTDAKPTLSDSLQMVARLIANREALQMKRQLFFVQLDGWDTHTHQTTRMASLMTELDQGLSSFQSTLKSQGLENSVTTFTVSEFGRSLAVNGGGTDHGWGAHSLVLGGSVNGGRLHGQAPSWQLGGADDAGNKGRFIPSTSINQLGAELARWFGLTVSDIAEIFPDLKYFEPVGQLDLHHS